MIFKYFKIISLMIERCFDHQIFYSHIPSSHQSTVQLHEHIEAKWNNTGTYIGVNIGSGNGLLPDGTKSSPEPMVTNHHRWTVVFTISQDVFLNPYHVFGDYSFELTSKSHRGFWVKMQSNVMKYCIPLNSDKDGTSARLQNKKNTASLAFPGEL